MTFAAIRNNPVFVILVKAGIQGALVFEILLKCLLECWV